MSFTTRLLPAALQVLQALADIIEAFSWVVTVLYTSDYEVELFEHKYSTL